ncbi:cobalt ECF transporter T component CbiQ [Thalassospira sp.]|uniref:cobalt ECF transporter T component CbiQ n=1 Tax=Thalassospira sp. TaxID=1912094 RepID=UPI000C4A19DF|nr:cobalt ECF transporter T component CbiQ [Thalassospira sp.]MBC07998.1 cobalt ECF transporter T component CbiQ [Thalassospira sp.]|tara:strand:- start:4119 stop:4916 length:798 start_codon:yes stop_codon:yes gene_type:complete
MSHLFGHDQPLNVRAGGGQTPSFVGAFDPRVRVVAACVFAIIVVALHQIEFALGALGLAAITMSLTDLPLRVTLKRMAAMDGFIIVMLVMLPFTTPGTPMFTILGAEASQEGLMHAVLVGIRANAVVLMMLSLLSGMTPVALGHTLYRLKCPPVLVHLMMFTVRYISVLHDEYHRLRMAMKLRGFKARNNAHTYRSFGYLFGMLVVRSLERAERVLEAMKCRGFSGHFPMIDDMAFRRRDGVFAVFFLALIAALVILDRTYVFAY